MQCDYLFLVVFSRFNHHPARHGELPYFPQQHKGINNDASFVFSAITIILLSMGNGDWQYHPQQHKVLIIFSIFFGIPNIGTLYFLDSYAQILFLFPDY